MPSSWAQSPARRGAWGGARGRHYGGPNNGIARVRTPVTNTGCGQQYSKPGYEALRDACIAGGEAAQRLAQRYAAQEGRSDGFRAGYAWGLRSGIDDYRNDATQMSLGQNVVRTGQIPALMQDLAAGDAQAMNAGQTQGFQDGTNEAVNRWHRATQNAPAGQSGAVPSSQITNADLSRLMGQSAYRSPYSDPYTQTVGQAQNEIDILNGPGIDYGAVTFYQDGYDTGIFGNPGVFRPGDFYRQDGRYAVNAGAYTNGQTAFNTYVSSPWSRHSDYDRLGTVRIQTGTQPAPQHPTPAPQKPVPPKPAPKKPTPPQRTAPVKPAPKKPAPQRPTAQKPVSVKPAPHQPAVRSPAQVQPIYTEYNLKEIYKQAFIANYNQFGPYEYNNAYNDTIDDGTNAGYYVGAQVGKRLAYLTGEMDAYNTMFRQRESQAYQSGYTSALLDPHGGFGSTYQTYATSAQIGVDQFTVTGMRDDGIIEPGEQILGSFTLSNYGGVDADLPVTLEGDVSNVYLCDAQGRPLRDSAGNPLRSIRVPRISSTRHTGAVTANIAGNVTSGQTANLVLNVNGQRIPLAQYVTRQVVVQNVTDQVDIAHGNLTIRIPVQNVSTVRSYDEIKIVTTDSLNRTQTTSVGFIEAGRTSDVPATLTGFDPLSMLDGQVSAHYQVLLGSEPIAQGTVVVSTNDRNGGLASVFDAASRGADQSLKQRVDDRIFNAVKAEAQSASSSDYNDKHPGLLYALVASKRAHPDNAAAYAALADLLTSHGRFKYRRAGIHFGKLSDNEKYFNNEVAILRGQLR